MTALHFSTLLLYKAEGDFGLQMVKTGGTQPKLSATCFVIQSCWADADFVIFPNCCLIGERQKMAHFLASQT